MKIDDHDEETYYLICDECRMSAFANVKTGELNFTDAAGNEIPF